jgi:uncharacterized membrane protein SpoIIM required for sporulation
MLHIVQTMKNMCTNIRYEMFIGSLVLLIFLFFPYHISYGTNADPSDFSSINIQFQANPDVVDAGKKVKFIMIINSHNASTITIIIPTVASTNPR